MTQPPPLWRQAFDAAEKRVTPRAEEFARSDTFAVGVALLRRATTVARDSARGVTTRFWHLIDLPAGTDVSRLRAQVGALDREVRRLTLQLEAERHRAAPPTPEEPHAEHPEPADRPRPGPARRRAQRPPGA
ncbi:hypothetical protein GCU56_05735 [Geodermatophilus sabuli]|uniref:Uncharacterized protein n=1 Tax=Geodermatophilus sabuli TaxID=1564158 RepID=A0A7K3VZ39_9ACTN|nr:hypothetical protein [Geodermatophilus sabuli]NEK57373.1 hypothetical protein [Geodermatophilus sabuli]